MTRQIENIGVSVRREDTERGNGTGRAYVILRDEGMQIKCYGRNLISEVRRADRGLGARLVFSYSAGDLGFDLTDHRHTLNSAKVHLCI